MVSADLSSIGKASSHPVRWSIIVRMCLLPDMDISHSITIWCVDDLQCGQCGVSWLVLQLWPQCAEWDCLELLL